MKTISLDGIVGLDILARDLRSELTGDEVEILISSPGGSVMEGLAVYNAIREYKRKGGKVKARVVGMAGSMSTYIPLAADTVEIEDNAVWMVHEPSTIALGRKADMQRAADILEGVSVTLARAYTDKTGKETAEIRQMMADETYLFGQEIIDAGFADSMVPAGQGAETKEEAEAIARAAVQDVEEKLKETREDLVQLAAMVGAHEKESKPVVNREIPAAKAEEIKEGAMDISALKTEHPDVFAQAVEIGVKQEQERVTALRSYIEADPENLTVAEVINEAIGNGKSVSDINARLQVAIRDGGKQAGENPPIVGSATEHGPVLSEEERKMCKAMGLSIEDYIKFQGEAE